VLRPIVNKLMTGAGQRAADPDLRREAGFAALDRGDLEAGRLAVLQSLDLAPPTLDKVLDVARRLASAGLSADAERVLRQSAEMFVDRVEPKLQLAWLFLEAGEDAMAIETAREALNQHPDNPDLHRVLAAAHERCGSLADAAESLAEVLATEPGDVEANRRMAGLLERLGDSAGATRCLERVVGLTRGQDREAMASLGIALSRNGQHKEAVRTLSDAAKRWPGVASVHGDLAMALYAAGQVEEAIWGFSEALRLDPGSAQAQCGLGLAYQRLERWEEAAAAFRLTESLAPDQSVGPFNLGLVLRALGNNEEARRALLRAAALAPEDEEIREALDSLASSVSAESPAPSPRFSGDLESFGLPEVLEFMRVQSKTGSVVISSRQGAGIVRLVQGRLTSASAPGIQRLGETLVNRGTISRSELEAALVIQRTELRQSTEALGSVLLRNRPGLREQLNQAILQQILDGLVEMLGWSEGAFSFHPAAESEIPSISFDTQSVVMKVFGMIDQHTSRSSSTRLEEDR
jgi:tetratricopeptide (TPR) repeat protein